jgi:hypothetical protein
MKRSASLSVITIAIGALGLSGSVKAATLLTDASGYSGPVLSDMGYSAYYTYSAGPLTANGEYTTSGVNLGGSETFTGNNLPDTPFPYSFVGQTYDFGFGTNGVLNYDANNPGLTDLAGVSAGTGTVTFTFSVPVATVGTYFNYGLPSLLLPPSAFGYNDPTISAYAANGGLIASYDLLTLAPITTTDGQPLQFRGIDGNGTLIGSFTFGGSYLAGEVTPTPIPSTWSMMLLGLAVLGFVGYRHGKKVTLPAAA